MNEQNFAVGLMPEPVEKPKNSYNKWDIILAALIIPLSFVIVRAISPAEYPLGNFICSLLLFVLSALYLKKQGVSLLANKFALCLGISSIVLSFGYVFSSNPSLRVFISFFCAFIYIYFVFAASGNSLERLPSRFFFFEMIKATFVMSFGAICALIEALGSVKKGRNIGKNLLLVISGLAIAFIPAMLAFGLLSYDDSFRSITRNLLDFSFADVASLIGDLILTFPLSLLLFGMLYSGRTNSFKEVFTEKSCEKFSSLIRFAPAVLTFSAILPFILIYSVFFISQLEYYLSAFGGVLPEGLSYAEYARSGFFELCAVSVINLLVILCATVFCKRGEGNRMHFSVRIMNILVSVSTLVLIATAISKMVLYIETYGLTEKRVLSSFFMIFLAVVFLGMLVKQISERVNVVVIALSGAVIISGFLVLSDSNRIIAGYNTERYLDGSLPGFEAEMLTGLGDAGYISLDRIAEESEDDKTRQIASEILQREARKRESGESSVFSLTLPKIRANKVLKKYR